MKSRSSKVAYGVGNLGQALFFNSVQTFLIFFYTDVVRLDPKLVARIPADFDCTRFGLAE
jgi:Na+/melibiose symporter-like transporter